VNVKKFGFSSFAREVVIGALFNPLSPTHGVEKNELGDTTYALGSGTADLTVSQANTVSPGVKWGLIGGIIAAIMVAGVVAW
jgi:hypothetical protein